MKNRHNIQSNIVYFFYIVCPILNIQRCKDNIEKNREAQKKYVEEHAGGTSVILKGIEKYSA